MDLIKREDAIKAIEDLPNAYNGWSDAYDKAYIIQTLEEVPSAKMDGEYIRREDAVRASWKALYDYQDEMETKFRESDDVEFGDWFIHRIFVQGVHGEILNRIVDIPSAEKQGENATRCYEFLKTKLGEGIVDSKKEFESWYERMVWHVKECDKLAREPKQGEWIDIGGYEVCKNCHEIKRFPHWKFCPNCGARMKGANDEQEKALWIGLLPTGGNYWSICKL